MKKKIKLQVITKEQAKKLKRLGFNLSCNDGYDEKEVIDSMSPCCKSYRGAHGTLPAPQIPLVFEWLREIKNYPIIINPSSIPKLYHVGYLSDDGWELLKDKDGLPLYLTWKKAEQKGLDHALNVIK